MSKSLVLLTAVSVIVTAACSDSSDQAASPATSTPAATDGSLVLDYTAYVPGAIQVSGIGFDPTDTMAAIVTDFEQVLIVEIATQTPIATFDVGRGELPRQGATEAVAFVDGERVAVLYPDDRTIGLFGLAGEPAGELSIPDRGVVDGALTVLDGALVMVSRQADRAELTFIDPSTEESRSVALDGEHGPFEGLGVDADGSALVAVTSDGSVVRIDAASGAVASVGVASEVDDASGIDVIVSLEEAETQIAVTDDADEYNDEPGPVRLFLG